MPAQIIRLGSHSKGREGSGQAHVIHTNPFHSSCDDYRAVAVFPTKAKCIRCARISFHRERQGNFSSRLFFNLCNSNFIYPSCFFLLREFFRFALTLPFISDSAYATWMTREASWALEEWTNSYLLTHQHIRASIPTQPIATAEQVHEEGIATLLSKLDDQGW
jgi:hypothetical protein